MESHLSATFDVISWEEAALDDADDLPRISWATLTSLYKGELFGESKTQWLIAYAEDGSTNYVGMERFRGSVAGREGSMVFRHVGTYVDSRASGSLMVVEGSGTGELASVSGQGHYRSHNGGSVTLRLTFD